MHAIRARTHALTAPTDAIPARTHTLTALPHACAARPHALTALPHACAARPQMLDLQSHATRAMIHASDGNDSAIRIPQSAIHQEVLMPRLTEAERTQLLDDHVAHWTQADALPGGPITLLGTYGLTQFQADRTTYIAKGDEILQLVATTLPLRMAERDALFGLTPDDDTGLWFWLNQYKAMVRALMPRTPLGRTAPNIGKVSIGEYLNILHRFLDHWKRVNEQLSAPLLIGTMTLAELQARHDALHAKLLEVAGAQGDLNLAREEREDLFGDVAEDEREDASVIARLLLYHAVIETRFPNQPIAQSLPPIFPVGGITLPRFDFNRRALAPGQEKTWVEDPSLPNAAVVFLKEGPTELTQAYSAAPGSTNAFTWNNVIVVNGLDAMELRDATGRTIARGTFNAGLAEV